MSVIDNEIIKIVIKGSSGYGTLEFSYKEKITLTKTSIKYDYKVHLSKLLGLDKDRKWSYTTNNPDFTLLFNSIAEMMPEIIQEPNEILDGMDVGGIEFIATYSDKSKASRMYWADGSYFKKCFMLIQIMVPEIEEMPRLLSFRIDG